MGVDGERVAESPVCDESVFGDAERLLELAQQLNRLVMELADMVNRLALEREQALVPGPKRLGINRRSQRHEARR